MCIANSHFVASFSPVVPALIALVGVVVGALLGARLTFQNQFRLATLQARQQTYAALLGKKFLLTQLYVSRFEALAYSDYHERLWHLAKAPKESLDLDEAKRWMRKSEDFVIDIAKANQSIFESVGMIRASYPSTTELNDLSERIYRFKTPTITAPAAGADRAALDEWKKRVILELQQLVQKEYAEPIDELLKHIKQHINDKVCM